MNFTLLELNELVYCVGTALKGGALVNSKVANKLYEKLNTELEQKCKELDKLMQAETDAFNKWG